MDTPAGVLGHAQELAAMLEPGDLDATLGSVTAAAVRLVPHADYASITVRHKDERLETVAATHDALPALDEQQYELREGPCYDAATDSLHVVAPDLATDGRFPRYGPVAVEAGIKAQAAFRLYERDGAQGALNVYSKRPDAFGDIAELEALFRSQTGVAIAYAHEITTLEEALATRTVIGQAVGIVMERFTLNDERAFAFLTRMSQSRNVKLRLIAEELVAEAAHRGDEACHDEPSATRSGATAQES